MWAFLVTPRALRLHVVMVVAVVAMVALAVWQWDRAHSRVADPVSLPPVTVDQVSAVGEPVVRPANVARRVTATGTYDNQKSFAILKPVAGSSEVWAMSILRLPDGSAVPVVHGRTRSVTEAQAVTLPTGQVVVSGRLQPSQNVGLRVSADDLKITYPVGGVLGGVSTSELVGLVDGPLRPGFIAAETEVPTVTIAEPLPLSEIVVLPRGLRVQNALYTVQWSLFALFALFVYGRALRDAWRDHTDWRDPILDEL